MKRSIFYPMMPVLLIVITNCREGVSVKVIRNQPDKWMKDYSKSRPHSALGFVPLKHVYGNTNN